MSQEYENLSQEIDAYIRWHYRPEGIKIKDFIGGLGGHTFGVGMDVHTGTAKWALSFLLDKLELTFSEKLMKLIEKKGRKPADVYTKAGVTKAHFSKIKADKDYHPTKETALAFVVALHLDLDEAADLLKRAGYTLSHSSESDLIVEFFIDRGIYNIDEINFQLDSRGHRTLTNWRKPADE